MVDNVSAIFEGLNSEQRRAVSQKEGAVLIVAGAGSGKTRVLTCRIANVLAGGVDSSRILALTFTKKAAAQMKERVAAMVGWRTARMLVMGTFHSVFVRFLRDYAEFLGYPRDFTIYDTSDSISMLKTCLKELNLDDKVYKPKTVLGRISEAKNNLVSPAAYLSSRSAVERDRISKMPSLAQVYDLYWRKCRTSGVMDFDDILFEMNILLRDNTDALNEISSRFDYIMVDEYQDTNRAQYIILKKLAARHGNICVVGDDSQSIYAFRGARIENILNFRKDYPDCSIFRLEQNYRSTRTIVSAANSLIAHNEGRIPKTCFSQGAEGEQIRLIRAYTEQEEAALTVSAIVSSLRREGAQYQDYAVLYRTNSQSRVLEEALRRRNIPYLIYSGNSFFDRAEVKDLMAYFKLCVNPSDDESFKRAVAKPSRGVGDTSLSALQAAALDKSCPLMQAAYAQDLPNYGLRPAGIARIRSFCDMISSFSVSVPERDAYELAVEIADKSGLWELYKSDMSVEGQARFANVEELCNSVKAFVEQRENEVYEDEISAQGQDRFSENGGPDGPSVSATGILVTLPEYLENVALLSAVDVDDGDSSNKVALMTVHSSKGLEFPYVFVVGMEENLFPGGGMMARPSDIEEERRLFYVAITRAKTAVSLSFAATRMRNGRSESNPVSRFIREIDSRYIANPLLDDAKQTRAELFRVGLNNYPTGNGPAYPSNTDCPSKTTGPSKTDCPVRPFKPAPRVPDEAFQPTPVMDLKEGQRVEHNRFGFGLLKQIINDATGMKAVIAFDDYGEKTLLLKYAKLRIV